MWNTIELSAGERGMCDLVGRLIGRTASQMRCGQDLCYAIGHVRRFGGTLLVSRWEAARLAAALNDAARRRCGRCCLEGVMIATLKQDVIGVYSFL